MRSLLKNKLNKPIFLGIIFLICIIIITGIYFLTRYQAHAPTSTALTETIITLSNQQKIRVLHSDNPEKGLLLFITNKNIDQTNNEYAKQFADLSYYVAIVDNQELLNSPSNTADQCVNLADKLTDISTQIYSHFNISAKYLPILVGAESSAATLYTVLAQTDKKIFHAAVGINFTPKLPAHSALCNQTNFIANTEGASQEHDLELKSLNRLPTSFYIFQNKNLPENTVTHEFVNNISNVRLTIAKEENQTPLSEAIQVLQWLDPRLEDQNSADASDSDLPLIEVNVTPDKINTTQTMAILLTGDGGWAEIDKELAKILATQGIPTVGFDSLNYFWKARTPVSTSQDIERVIAQYLEKWNKKYVILIGYSFGADVLPFVANHLSANTQQQISLIALLGMSKTAAFEFHLSSWMDADKNIDRPPLLPEIEKMKWANSICIYGVDDDAANCLPTAKYNVKVISINGDHHFDEKYDELAKHIIDNQKIH